jgi:hypothetical protein
MDDYALDRVEGRFLWQAGDLDELEPVKSEFWPPRFRFTTLKNISVGSAGFSQILRHQRTVLMQHFAVSNPDTCPAFAPDGEFNNT